MMDSSFFDQSGMRCRVTVVGCVCVCVCFDFYKQ